MTRVEHARRQLQSSRAAVGRDTLTILGGALLAVILGNLAGFGAPVGDLSSPTPEDSSTIIGGGSLPPRVTFPPIDTLGGVVNPTVGFEVTPTPIPIITLGPSASPSPSPSPSVKPTVKPSAKPTPTPTATPAPVAVLSCLVSDLTVTCDGSGSQHVKPADPAAYSWTFGDLATATGVTAQHVYSAYGPYTITLTVTGLDGVTTSTNFQDVNLTPPPTP